MCGAMGDHHQMESATNSYHALVSQIASSSRVFHCARDRKSTRLNSSHSQISYAVFCLKNNTRHLILIADDAAYNRKTVAAYLRHVGCVVMQASHGLAVLQQLKQDVVWDGLVLDVNMPR